MKIVRRLGIVQFVRLANSYCVATVVVVGKEERKESAPWGTPF